MKHIIISLVFYFLGTTMSVAQINNSGSNLQIQDTSAYLRDSIVANRSYYIGKTLSVLLNRLQLPIKAYTNALPLPNQPDTILVYRTVFYFTDTRGAFIRMADNLKTPFIEVRFAAPVPVPKAYLKKGKLLDSYTGWTTAKANFYGNWIIADLQVGGVMKEKEAGKEEKITRK
jgi:hypothetical protein